MKQSLQTPGGERPQERTVSLNSLRESLKGAGESVLKATNVIRGWTRRMLVIGSFLAPAVAAGASQYGCSLDTYGTGKSSEQDSGGAGGDGGGQDSMMTGDSSSFPDAAEHKDADAMAAFDADADGTVGVDATVDADADVIVEFDADADFDADVTVDATVDGDADAADTGSDVVDATVDVDADVSDTGVDVKDAETDADAGTDAGADASDADAGSVCSSSGTVVFDATMPCYKEGLFRSGDFLPSPDSSEDTATCQTGLCANSPNSGDVEVLWVQETLNTGLFTSTSVPVSYAAHCSSYTSAAPPSLTQMKAELSLPTGWSVPGVSKVGTSYTLTASSCAGSAVLYEIVY